MAGAEDTSGQPEGVALKDADEDTGSEDLGEESESSEEDDEEEGEDEVDEDIEMGDDGGDVVVKGNVGQHQPMQHHRENKLPLRVH